VWSIPSAAYADTMSWPVDDIVTAARATLDALAVHVAKLHPATDAVLRMGSEWRAILDVVSERGIDIVVMGTHGRRGVPRILLGSIAEKIVRLSPVPVLTVKGPESRP